MLVPESEEELIAAVTEARKSAKPYFVLGRGSNILATDGVVDQLVIKNTEACRALSIRDDGQIEVGASVELQRFIRFSVEQNREGMEYLQSVPGNMGGAVCMNAGRGEQFKKAISDYLTEVDVFDGERVVTLDKSACKFGYRTSIFRKRDWVVLRARFALPPQEKDRGLELITERMRYVREAQDNRFPNAGSVFARRFRLHTQLMGDNVGDAQFSKRTSNWILNTGQASCADVLRLIRRAQWRHMVRGHLPPALEWVFLK